MQLEEHQVSRTRYLRPGGGKISNLTNFAGDKCRAGKKSGFFPFKTVQKKLVGNSSDEICPSKFIHPPSPVGIKIILESIVVWNSDCSSEFQCNKSPGMPSRAPSPREARQRPFCSIVFKFPNSKLNFKSHWARITFRAWNQI